MWVPLAGRLSDALHENIRSNFDFCCDNNVILFYFVCFGTLTQAHACGRALVANQPIGDKFVDFCWGHVRVATGSRLPGVYQFFVLFCFRRAHKLMRRHLRITRIYFLFLLITDNPCLVLNCLTGGTFCQGAHICPLQLARP